MLVKIDEGQALEMLKERVRDWTQDKDVQYLFERMYENYIYGGCFEGCKFDVMAIVDNDFVNWCSVIFEGEDGFNELLDIYKEQGLGDCSFESDCYNCIEAVDDEDEPTMFLVRS